MEKKLRIILTGATGMVGEGVLHECLQNNKVEKIVVINRKSCGVFHPKLTEIIHPDFFDLSALNNQLIGFDACFFCLGISSIGVKEEEYYKMTYTLTLLFANLLCKTNTNLTFCYVSGAGTDSFQKSKLNWANVKGKTENDLQTLSFKQVFSFRPAFIKAIPGLKFTHPWYRYAGWLFPIGRAIYPKGFCTLQEISKAMIHVTLHGFKKNIIEGKDIIDLAKLEG